MGYDVEFVQIRLSSKVVFPVDAAEGKKLRARAASFNDPNAVRKALLEIPGCRPGPGEAIDYVGRGLNCARLSIRQDAIHVENNCNARELLKLHEVLTRSYPDLLLVDLQSQQLHSAASFAEWWSRPL